MRLYLSGLVLFPEWLEIALGHCLVLGHCPLHVHPGMLSLLFICFRVSVLTSKSLIPLELFLYRVKCMDLVYFFAGGHLAFPALYIEEVVFSPMYVCGIFMKNQIDVTVWVLIESFILFHWSTHLVQWCFVCMRYVVWLELRHGESPKIVLFTKGCFHEINSWMASELLRKF